MAKKRRAAVNETKIQRLEDIPYHNAWVCFVCVKCKKPTFLDVGLTLPNQKDVFVDANWICVKCGYVHSQTSDLPFPNWPKEATAGGSLRASRFWQGFFRTATENPNSFWKQCNTCGRILPFAAFSEHGGWGALERQMECRACKGAINAVLNPKRTKQQLFEGNIRRRTADLLLKDENEHIDHKKLFARFGSKCFKTDIDLDINARGTWNVDHILPSLYLYPLTERNAALLSKDANANKRHAWPNKFYNAKKLIQLARITGADLTLLSSPEPIVNTNIDVNKMVSRVLSVRNATAIHKRVAEIKKLINDYGLEPLLSKENKQLLGF